MDLPQASAGELTGRNRLQNFRFDKAVTCTLALLAAVTIQAADAQPDVTPAEARAIAREAYSYANPMADSYRILYGSFVDPSDPEYKGPWNQIRNFARVYTSDD